jgi:hypothetical protein
MRSKFVHLAQATAAILAMGAVGGAHASAAPPASAQPEDSCSYATCAPRTDPVPSPTPQATGEVRLPFLKLFVTGSVQSALEGQRLPSANVPPTFPAQYRARLIAVDPNRPGGDFARWEWVPYPTTGTHRPGMTADRLRARLLMTPTIKFHVYRRTYNGSGQERGFYKRTEFKARFPFTLLAECPNWGSGNARLYVRLVRGPVEVYDRSRGILETVANVFASNLSSDIDQAIAAGLGAAFGSGNSMNLSGVPGLLSRPDCSSLGIRLGSTSRSDLIIYDGATSP